MTSINNESANLDPYLEIINLLEVSHASYQVICHEPVYTSEQAEAISGLSLSQGAKTIVLSAKDAFVIAVIPGDKKLDMKKVARCLGLKKVRFATEDEVEKVMRCKIGACYPFGSFINVRMIVDPSLAQEQKIAFNPGKNDQSIIMDTADYLRIVNPEMQSIAKESKS